MNHATDTRWWPALDGLRGVAVTAVVLYHLDESLVPGGFLGVGLFFSISGFLIVGQLSAEREATGRIALRRFWARRARRLMPAFSVTVLASVIAVAVQHPDDLDRVVAEGLAGFAYVANWHDMFSEITYADRFSDGVEPLSHLWSLSIEEQVYLIAPIIIGIWGLRRAAWLSITVATVALVVWWGNADAYFVTPVRLIEVLVGAGLGVHVHRGGGVPAALVRAAVPAGLAAVALFAFVADTDSLLFTGGLGVWSVIWVTLIAGALTDGPVGRLLSTPILRWVGWRSYAIYLFHVPLIELTDWSPLQVVVVTLLAAELSHRLIEAPVRAGVVSIPRLAVGTAAAAVAVGLSTVVLVTKPDVVAAVAAEMAAVAPTTTQAPEPALIPTSVTTAPTHIAATVTAPVEPAAEPATIPAMIPSGLRVMTVGDSTIGQLQPALEAFVELHDGELFPRAVPGCSPLFTNALGWNLRFTEEPEGFVPAGHCRPSVATLIADVGGADVVIMMDHGMALVEHQRVGTDVWTDLTDPELAEALLERYEQWADETAAARAVLLLFTAPPAAPDTIVAAQRGSNEAERLSAYNDIVRSVAERSPSSVILLDFAAAIASDADRYERPDGVHFRDDSVAAAVVVDYVGPGLGAGLSNLMVSGSG